MTKVKIKADKIITNYLRTNLTDVNSSRLGNWIFPDFPRVVDLGNASFPRIGITIISDGSDMMGFNDNTQWHNINIQIDVVTKKDLSFTKTISDEALGTMAATSNSDRMVFDYSPSTVTNIKHAGTSYGTVTIRATDSAFTTPATGTVEVSYSTGNVNFSAADIVSGDTEAITSTYTVVMEGKKAVEHLAQEIVKLLRSNWRKNSELTGIQKLSLINNSSVPIDEDLGIFRQMLEYNVSMINVGEGI